MKKGQDKTISSFEFHTICTKLTCANIIQNFLEKF